MTGTLDAAVAGQSVTLVLADEIDVGRGDLLAGAENAPAASDQLSAQLLWMHEDPLLPERQYWLKIGTRLTTAQVTGLRYRIDPVTLEHAAARTLALNEVGGCNLALAEAVAFDPYREVRETGGFILIDRFTNATVGAGMIDFGLRRADNLSPAVPRGRQGAARSPEKPAAVRPVVHRPARLRQVDDREPGREEARRARPAQLPARRGQRAAGAQPRPRLHRCGPGGEHPPGRRGREALRGRGPHRARVVHLAPSATSAGWPARWSRRASSWRSSSTPPSRNANDAIPRVSTERPRSGEIRNFTGIDSAYEPPEDPELVLNTVERSVDEVSDEVIAWLRDGGYL